MPSERRRDDFEAIPYSLLAWRMKKTGSLLFFQIFSDSLNSWAGLTLNTESACMCAYMFLSWQKGMLQAWTQCVCISKLYYSVFHTQSNKKSPEGSYKYSSPFSLRDTHIHDAPGRCMVSGFSYLKYFTNSYQNFFFKVASEPIWLYLCHQERMLILSVIHKETLIAFIGYSFAP